ISRIVTKLVPVVKAVLEEFVPDAKDAIEMVKGRVVLVDGTITPCWSYEDHPELWSRKKGIAGFNEAYSRLPPKVQANNGRDGCRKRINGAAVVGVHDAPSFE